MLSRRIRAQSSLLCLHRTVAQGKGTVKVKRDRNKQTYEQSVIKKIMLTAITNHQSSKRNYQTFIMLKAIINYQSLKKNDQTLQNVFTV